MTKKSLTCNNLCVFRGDAMILENMGFTAMPGSCIQIVGRNGSGKTSFLRCLARLDDSNLGSITYNGCNVDDFIDEYKQILIYVSDKDQLDEDMTVYETGNIWSMMYGSEMLLPAAVQTLNLDEYLEDSIKTLSKGTKKRVVLMRLMLQKARIWLLDEPFSNLDQHSIDLVINLFDVHTSSGGIVIFSDHQENLSKAIAKTTDMVYDWAGSPQSKKSKISLRVEDFSPM